MSQLDVVVTLLLYRSTSVDGGHVLLKWLKSRCSTRAQVKQSKFRFSSGNSWDLFVAHDASYYCMVPNHESKPVNVRIAGLFHLHFGALGWLTWSVLL